MCDASSTSFGESLSNNGEGYAGQKRILSESRVRTKK